MHTIIVLALGLAILGIGAFAGRVYGGRSAMATACLAFVPLWFFGAGFNMYMGVKKAGYSVSDELPIFCVVFVVPALTALVVTWKLR